MRTLLLVNDGLSSYDFAWLLSGHRVNKSGLVDHTHIYVIGKLFYFLTISCVINYHLH